MRLTKWKFLCHPEILSTNCNKPDVKSKVLFLLMILFFVACEKVNRCGLQQRSGSYEKLFKEEDSTSSYFMQDLIKVKYDFVVEEMVCECMECGVGAPGPTCIGGNYRIYNLKDFPVEARMSYYNARTRQFYFKESFHLMALDSVVLMDDDRYCERAVSDVEFYY